MTPSTPRKGARRGADIPDDVRLGLSQGRLQSVTLVEGLAVDQAQLLRAVFPDLQSAVLAAAAQVCERGILQRMGGMASLLFDALGSAGTAVCQAHASDTVRGWACFMVGNQPDLTLAERLAAIRPLADDAHFGVREWAWMAVRPHLARELDAAVVQLTAWTENPSERLRRFACEALRPRGVWCAHIAAFKQQPEAGLPILSPLRADASVYVQDSVANWLNDAGKDQPDWVRALCAQWLQGEPSAATRRICQRALRNL
ncbi:DNA alkylation repair protein [Acidovorax sp. Be4]|uniref:DNA alkylation repair protein n=1 Tax=Acidovorax bellezanensis TaxID=2976702 RepID=A0ABT2PV22_9BURK|nr:DNA alkylation repair protein [Acidovorax sp. Be4]MCT9813122.1 DNA alkylation repair protein [Acidovorax sp. Be4]